VAVVPEVLVLEGVHVVVGSDETELHVQCIQVGPQVIAPRVVSTAALGQGATDRHDAQLFFGWARDGLGGFFRFGTSIAEATCSTLQQEQCDGHGGEHHAEQAERSRFEARGRSTPWQRAPAPLRPSGGESCQEAVSAGGSGFLGALHIEALLFGVRPRRFHTRVRGGFLLRLFWVLHRASIPRSTPEHVLPWTSCSSTHT